MPRGTSHRGWSGSVHECGTYGLSREVEGSVVGANRPARGDQAASSSARSEADEPHRARSDDWKCPLKRDRVFSRDDYRCVYCGKRFAADELSVDHVEPRVRGGDQSTGNLVTACKGCNTLKGQRRVSEF